MRFPRPLQVNYAATLATAILAITPYIFVTTASALFEVQIEADLGTDPTALRFFRVSQSPAMHSARCSPET